MRSLKLKSTALAALLLLTLAGSGFAQISAPRPELPDLVLNTMDGVEWRLHGSRGNVVVLNFWATWCEPCRTEVPMLIKVGGDYEKGGVKVVGVAVDEGGPAVIRKFMAEYKIDYPILIPPAGSPFSNVERMPTTLLIDQRGRMAAKYFGLVPEKTLRADIEQLLAEEQADDSKPQPASR